MEYFLMKGALYSLGYTKVMNFHTTLQVMIMPSSSLTDKHAKQ